MKEVIDLSSDEDEGIVMNFSSNSHSGFSFKRKEADELDSSTAICHNAKGGRVVAKTKKLKLALIPSASAVSKKSRVEENKKADESAMITAANAPEKRIVVDKKVGKVVVASYRKIPQVILYGIVPRNDGSGDYKSAPFRTHAFLARKKVILYGLPGFHVPPEMAPKWRFATGNLVWQKFCFNSVIPPVLEFIEHAEVLKANGVDQILFITMNFNVMDNTRHHFPIIHSLYPYVQLLADYNVMYNPKSFNRRMELGGLDICEGWIPPRTRKFIFLVDDLKVKYSNIESKDRVFLPPTSEEIIHAFNA